MGIRLLPDSLSNKIAAGEVVERPASVVKELIENALDAGADEIFIDIENAGVSRIRVIDNGCGIAPDELVLAVQRHATSKILSEDDLFSITSFGFRGEALPSIASVSRFRMVSKRIEDDVASFIEIEGGNVVSEGKIGAPNGTEVDVKDLFFNVPARRKFLKRPATEFSHIVDIVSRIFLLRHDVRVVLKHNGTEILNLPKTNFDIDRAAKLLGKDVWKNLFPVQQEWQEYKIWALISAPEFVRRTSSSAFYFYINGRPIRDKILHQAVINAYGTLVEKGSYPVVVLNLIMPPNDVDVNVHPAKSEVRFKDRNKVFSFVRSSLVKTIDAVPWLKQSDIDNNTTVYDYNDIPAVIEKAANSFADKEKITQRIYGYRTDPTKSGLISQSKSTFTPRFVNVEESKPKTLSSRFINFAIENVERSVLPEGKYSNLAVIGVLNNTYILTESNRGLVVIDQHAAHERVLFVKLKKSHQRKGIEKSTQLFPIVVNVGERLSSVAKDNMQFLDKAGFEVEVLSGGSVAVKTVPMMTEKKIDPAKLITDLLEDLMEFGDSSASDDIIDLVVATTACHSAIRAGDSITLNEAEELLHLLDETDRSGYCPHGRPVIIEIGLPELERRFGRRG